MLPTGIGESIESMLDQAAPLKTDNLLRLSDRPFMTDPHNHDIRKTRRKEEGYNKVHHDSRGDLPGHTQRVR